MSCSARLRIIPARAGSTRIVHDEDVIFEDHPRSCGEHYLPVSSATCFLGSSPLVRGARVRLAVVFVASGIIPARAGSTDHARVHLADVWDHPRSCGEHGVRNC